MYFISEIIWSFIWWRFWPSWCVGTLRMYRNLPAALCLSRPCLYYYFSMLRAFYFRDNMAFHMVKILALLMCCNYEIQLSIISEVCPRNDFCTSSAKVVREGWFCSVYIIYPSICVIRITFLGLIISINSSL